MKIEILRTVSESNGGRLTDHQTFNKLILLGRDATDYYYSVDGLLTTREMKDMIETIKKIILLLDKKEKRKAIGLLLIATAGAFFEMLGVSLMVPLMTAIMEPEIIANNALIARFCTILGIESHRGFIILCIVAMIAVFVIKDLFLLFENTSTAKFVFENRFRMQQKMLRAFLRKPYSYYLNAQSGEILRIIRTDVQNTYALLDMLLSLISESIVSLAIILVVVLINPLMTLLIGVFVSIIMLIIVKVIKPILREEGVLYRKNLSKAYKWMLQSIHGIKEIKIGRREEFFEGSFEKVGKQQVESEKRYAVLNGIPRIIIELGCICAALIAMLIMIVSGREPKTLVPAFSAFAMAAVKLMPAFSRVINAVSSIVYHGPSIDRLLENISSLPDDEAPSLSGEKIISLHDKVEFKNVTFRYKPESESILENASMIVPAGSSVGISGVSGVGKTTAVDILLGLLKPENGEILCDGVNIADHYNDWLEHVSYIPQSIFMLDGSIRENVVFGSKVSDDSKIWAVLEDAQLADFVKKQPDGLDTQIGERGIRLSGGQRQRIGIARALYSEPELLVLDEATSSLDALTESGIMTAIHALHGKKTMIIIAHRLETIGNCDMVYRIENKKIILERK